MKRHGFTLIELLMVLAIISILTSMILSGVFAVLRTAKRYQTLIILAKVDSALRQFRTDVRWERALLCEDGLTRIEYINYDYWVELSVGSRQPSDAAERVRQGVDLRV